MKSGMQMFNYCSLTVMNGEGKRGCVAGFLLWVLLFWLVGAASLSLCRLLWGVLGRRGEHNGTEMPHGAGTADNRVGLLCLMKQGRDVDSSISGRGGKEGICFSLSCLALSPPSSVCWTARLSSLSAISPYGSCPSPQLEGASLLAREGGVGRVGVVRGRGRFVLLLGPDGPEGPPAARGGPL